MTMIGEGRGKTKRNDTVHFLSGEYYVLKVRPSTSIQMSVYLMIFGSVVAASNDLAFNMLGYGIRLHFQVSFISTYILSGTPMCYSMTSSQLAMES